MTTIAWDGKSVAADSMAMSGNYVMPKRAVKICRIGETVYAGTGSASLFNPMIKWHHGGADPKDLPVAKNETLTLIVFERDRCFTFRSDEPYPDESFAPDAWGGGYQYAIGAMKNGADARRAVEVAIECVSCTGGEITVESLQQPNAEQNGTARQ